MQPSGNAGASRRANFNSYYQSHPDKLQGQTVDEAYARMQRQAQRNANHPIPQGASLDAPRQAPVAPQGNPATLQNTVPGYNIIHHLLGGGGGAPQHPQPMHSNPATLENTLPGYGTLENNINLQAIHNAIARRFANTDPELHAQPVTHNPATLANTIPGYSFLRNIF